MRRSPLATIFTAVAATALLLTGCSTGASDTSAASHKPAKAASPKAETVSEVGKLTYPESWDIPAVPNGDTSNASFKIRFDGVLIFGEVTVPSVSRDDADAWLNSSADTWGVQRDPDKDQVLKSAEPHMKASVQYNEDGSTLFINGHGWGSPVEPGVLDSEKAVKLPSEWAALPFPKDAPLQYAFAQFSYDPKNGIDWKHPTYNFTLVKGYPDGKSIVDQWAASLNKDKYQVAGTAGDGATVGGAFQILPGAESDDFPTFGARKLEETATTKPADVQATPSPSETKQAATADWADINGRWCPEGQSSTDCVEIAGGRDVTFNADLSFVESRGECLLGSATYMDGGGANVLYCPAGAPTPGADFTPRFTDGEPVIGDNPTKDRIWFFQGPGANTLTRG
ncbi:hypothetical protein [Curtobacterium sp. MCSS17_016]|uniref:hypothetical protein n=1 Tax=Curtobacterium sp. MCSS17_016 TaxID=2175644 RepID=UPI000DA6FC41|nr:hypothetical protein [Curtobacterium sp. MCSS17_016]WIE81550.1 hypothetical protein DEJ19_020135 [Curtobacterium sp. MCSS17_016]